MVKDLVFESRDYKAYLVNALDARTVAEKGQRSKLAAAMGCQPAYLSQVLNGSQELSLEQAEAASRFLGHSANETRYFLNLVLLARSGTQGLRRHFQEELQKQKDDRAVLKNRMKVSRTLNEHDQARYYSSWYYAAIHVIVSLGSYRNKTKISKALGLPLATVSEVLEFLTQIGLLQLRGSEYRQGETNLFLGSDSPFITKHHTNWRMKAVQSLDQLKTKDLHYSGVITCSKEDAEKIREVMVQAIQKVRGIVKDSVDETMYVYTLDLFNLLRTEED